MGVATKPGTKPSHDLTKIESDNTKRILRSTLICIRRMHDAGLQS